MDFSKIPHPVNFKFPPQGKFPFAAELENFENGIWRLRIRHSSEEMLPGELSLPPDEAALTPDFSSENPVGKVVFKAGHLRIFSPQGTCLLESAKEGFFGTAQKSWVMRFVPEKKNEFYGLGAKTGPLEKTGMRTQMWNVDAWGSHGVSACRDANPDPFYANIPFLLLKRGPEALGILVHNPCAVFFSLNPEMRLHPSQEKVEGSAFYWGSTRGPAEIFFITGEDVASVLRRYGRLVGTTPRPPLWSLGYHQCRWGYSGTKDLERLDFEMTKAGIPCDGLWLDIDSMDRYKVFTTNPKTFKNPERTMAKLLKKGRHVVAILDPGVRDEKGYSVRESGIKQEAFCKNPNGDFYRGFVWPGATLFPDFSTDKGKNWWKDQVCAFSKKGFSGFWLDMNDPSTGSVTQEEMLFNQGKAAHETYHNLYATGMAKATRNGLLESRPEKRPFLLSRSGSTGIGQYAALWLGDNFSHWRHLKASIPMALGLSMSGVPFVGADVGGFGDDVTEDLMVRWVEAACLFPFFRIHSAKDAKEQEPWQFSKKALARIRECIQFRYRMLPYLYETFMEHERTGAPVMRPLFYLGKEAAEIAPSHFEDEFLIGDKLLVAPILEAKTRSREVQLPKGDWFCLADEKWYRGGKPFHWTLRSGGMPVFVKNGSLVPQFEKKCTTSTADLDLSRAQLPLYIKPGFTKPVIQEYRYDEGEGVAYKIKGDTIITLVAKPL